MQNPKLDWQKINRYYKVKSTDVFEKHKQDYDLLLGDLTIRKALDSGAAFKVIIELYYGQMKELTDLYIESIFDGIDNDFYLDRDIIKVILARVQTFIATTYANKSASLRGMLSNRNFLNSITGKSILNNFSGKYSKIWDTYKDKVIIAIDRYNKGYELLQEKENLAKDTKVDLVYRWFKNHWFFSIVIVIVSILVYVLGFVSILVEFIQIIL